MSTGRVDTYVVGELKTNDGFILTVKYKKKYYPIVLDIAKKKFVAFEAAWAWFSGYNGDKSFDVTKYKLCTFMTQDDSNCIYTPEGKGYLYVTDDISGELVLNTKCTDDTVTSGNITLYPIHANLDESTCRDAQNSYVFRMVKSDKNVITDYPYTTTSRIKNHLTGTQLVLYNCFGSTNRNVSVDMFEATGIISANDSVYGGLPGGSSATKTGTITTSTATFVTLAMFPTKWVTTGNCTRDWSTDKPSILSHFCPLNATSKDKWFTTACKDTYKGYTSSKDPTQNATYQVANGILYKYGTGCGSSTLELANMVDNENLKDTTSDSITWAPTSDVTNMYCSYNKTNSKFQQSSSMYGDAVTCPSKAGKGDKNDGSSMVWIIVIIIVSVIGVIVLVIMIFAGTHYLKKGTADPEDISSTNGGVAYL
jgi:hypothetical protein